MKNRKLIIGGLVVLLIIVFGLNVYISLPKAIKAINEKTVTITVIDQPKNVDKTYTIKTSQDTLLDALKPLGIVSGVETDNSYTITTVNSLEANSSSGESWRVLVNGSETKASINNIEIQNNDHIEFDLVTD
ncbi:MAG: DUF4430 domain-containing protein [Clostridium perfringens]|nr:DUF4430 domain-containing protein [Clostridium perfringens]